MGGAGSRGTETLKTIKAAGERLIARDGFDAMSLRALAAEVGVRPASLYNHIDGKQALLFQLIDETTHDLLESVEAALIGLVGPSAKLKAVIEAHIEFHLAHWDAMAVVSAELRRLTPDDRAIVDRRFASYEKLLKAIIKDGVRQGDFEVKDVKLTARAIIGALTGLGHWPRSADAPTRKKLVRLYGRMAMGAVGAGR